VGLAAEDHPTVRQRPTTSAIEGLVSALYRITTVVPMVRSFNVLLARGQDL
jgi:hypothetical protein